MDKINRYFLQAHIPSLTNGDTFLIPVPITGDIKKIMITNEIAVTVAQGNCVLSTIEADGSGAVTVVGGDITVPVSDALSTATLEVAKVATTRVTAGDSIRGIMDSDATSAGPGYVLIEITI